MANFRLRHIVTGILIIGVLIGIAHLRVAIKAVFVFRGNEPMATWIYVASGPFSTLPAVTMAFFRPRIGAAWLIGGALLSSVMVAMSTGSNEGLENTASFFITYSAPMLILGLVAYLKSRFKLAKNGG